VEEAVDDHEVCKHYADGAELVADFTDSKRRLPEEVVPRLRLIDAPLAVREWCWLRRLRVPGVRDAVGARRRQASALCPCVATG
jgi:hypothetical protein